ncbi:hypothetical protein ATO13_08256 [Stappia sp. 22II-S9-Z10]|nr:hypothetical protein ATO13_08256 [Stappia sp. 22II-S9-Z10]
MIVRPSRPFELECDLADIGYASRIAEVLSDQILNSECAPDDPRRIIVAGEDMAALNFAIRDLRKRVRDVESTYYGSTPDQEANG